MRDQKRKMDNGTLLVWGGTALLALVIVGVSVFLAVGRQGGADPRRPVLAPVAAVTAQISQEPVVIPQDQEDALEQPKAAEAPPPATQKETGDVELKLDHLAGTLKLSLPFLGSRDKIPLENTCFRQNVSPAMNWSGAPPGTKSFVVFMEKRETPESKPFVTWIMFDIPGELTGLPEAMPNTAGFKNGAKHANSDHNNIGYIGPCEARGKMPYALRVFALDTVLGAHSRTSKNNLIRSMNGHIIDAAEQRFIHYYKL